MVDGTMPGFDWVIDKYHITHCPYLVHIAPKKDDS